VEDFAARVTYDEMAAETGRLDAAIAPGTYRVIFLSGALISGDPMFTASPLELLQVDAGQPTVQRFELESAWRELLVRFADGSPVLEGSVELVPAHAPPALVPFGLFQSGWGELPQERWMGVGRYRVELDGEARVEFDWEPGDGVLVVEI
jgi:hypothetical protein